MSVESDAKAWRDSSPYLELRGHPLALYLDERADQLLTESLSKEVADPREQVFRMREVRRLMSYVQGQAAKAARAHANLREAGNVDIPDLPAAD